MSCTCDREYDSVTGEMNDYVCDWCQEKVEQEKVEQEKVEQEEEEDDYLYQQEVWERDHCHCEYGYERGEDRWGRGGYRYLEWECDVCEAERKKSEPTVVHAAVTTTPTAAVAKPDPWATEKSTIGRHIDTFSACSTPAERVEVLQDLFVYIRTIKPFLTAFPRFHAVCVAKVAELKADPLAAPIARLLVQTERFLAS